MVKKMSEKFIVLENNENSAVYQVKGTIGTCVEVTDTHAGWIFHKNLRPYDFEGHMVHVEELLIHRDFAYTY